MSLLDSIHQPSDLRALSKPQLKELAAEIRSFLISTVCKNGGHMGPNLGVVELTIGLHLVFDSPEDPIIFDTGHQSYIHKILTGRVDDFATLRQKNGLSGYPSRNESAHDWVENSHASASLAWAAGLAKGFKLKGADRTVVAVIGDGALTGGMAWEALNNIATEDNLRLVIVVNDNGRSYNATVGGLSTNLTAMRTNRTYEKTLKIIKDNVSRTPLVGRSLYDLLHGLKVGLKDMLAPQSMFGDLGLKYIGPIDGHNINSLTTHLMQAKQFKGPVIVHAITRKGRGFAAAENNEEDRLHAVGKMNEFTGKPLVSANRETWSNIFSTAIEDLGSRNKKIVALTAAMMHPVGLAKFAASYPDRVFDVGIAEQFAVTAAAGLSAAGFHPVFAVYATFLNRAFDQVLMDVALHKQGVTFVLDRAGITGPDGPSHHGMWDISLFGLIPGVQLAAPRDKKQLIASLERAVTVDNAPTIIRYAKGSPPKTINEVAHYGQGDNRVDILIKGQNPQVLIVAIGEMVTVSLDVAKELKKVGVEASVIDPLWALPIRSSLIKIAAEYEFIVTIEDNLVESGFGTHFYEQAGISGVCKPFKRFGIPQEFIEHASRDEILDDIGLTSVKITQEILEFLETK